MNEFLHLFQAGGFMMYPLLAASIIAVAITVERARMYRKSKTDMTLLASHLSKPLHEGKLFEAEKIAANAGGLTGDLILKAIAHERHIDDMASWLEMEGQHRAASLKANLGILSVIVTLAPLMGLLGTVLGMIRSFDVLNVANGEPFAITGGVAEALTATAFGLFVAILALICWACLNQRAERLVGELEHGAGLYLVSRKKGGAAEVPAEPASHPAKADTPSPISQASRITAAQTASGAFSS